MTYTLTPNDDVSHFIEKTKVTSYEITKVFLTRSQVSRTTKLPY